MIIQHNMAAANTNRQLGITTGNLAKSTEKLSSGYKINRAGDNAAGLCFPGMQFCWLFFWPLCWVYICSPIMGLVGLFYLFLPFC